MQEKSRCQLWNFFHNTAIKSKFILSGLLGGGPTKAKAKILPGSNVIQGNYDHYAAIRWSSADPEHHTATSDQNSAEASALPGSQIRRTDDSVQGLSGEFGTGTNYRACSGMDDLEVNGRRTDDSVQGLLTSSVQTRNA